MVKGDAKKIMLRGSTRRLRKHRSRGPDKRQQCESTPAAKGSIVLSQVASMSSLKLDACGKLKGPGSAGAEESTCRGHGGIEIGLHGLRGLAILCRLVRANGDITPRIIDIAEEFVPFRAATLKKTPFLP